jgi:hypothetical protein
MASKDKTKKFRLNLEFPSEIEQRLKQLKERSESATTTEVIRKSLALFNLYLNQVQAGRALIFRDPDGSEEKLQIL